MQRERGIPSCAAAGTTSAARHVCGSGKVLQTITKNATTKSLYGSSPPIARTAHHAWTCCPRLLFRCALRLLLLLFRTRRRRRGALRRHDADAVRRALFRLLDAERARFRLVPERPREALFQVESPRRTMLRGGGERLPARSRCGGGGALGGRCGGWGGGRGGGGGASGFCGRRGGGTRGDGRAGSCRGRGGPARGSARLAGRGARRGERRGPWAPGCGGGLQRRRRSCGPQDIRHGQSSLKSCRHDNNQSPEPQKQGTDNSPRCCLYSRMRAAAAAAADLAPAAIVALR